MGINKFQSPTVRDQHSLAVENLVAGLFVGQPQTKRTWRIPYTNMIAVVQHIYLSTYGEKVASALAASIRQAFEANLVDMEELLSSAEPHGTTPATTNLEAELAASREQVSALKKELDAAKKQAHERSDRDFATIDQLEVAGTITSEAVDPMLCFLTLKAMVRELKHQMRIKRMRKWKQIRAVGRKFLYLRSHHLFCFFRSNHGSKSAEARYDENR